MKFARCWRILTLAAALVAAAVPALAGNACYAPEQARAEQLLRLHSELMVIVVTCRQGSQGENLPAAYGEFTRKNIHVLHDAEQTMIAYYKAKEKGDATGHLDHLRTLLGNEYGQKVADMSAPAFCETFRDKVLRFDAAMPADIEQEVQRMQVSGHTYVKSCNAKNTVVVKKGR